MKLSKWLVTLLNIHVDIGTHRPEAHIEKDPRGYGVIELVAI